MWFTNWLHTIYCGFLYFLFVFLFLSASKCAIMSVYIIILGELQMNKLFYRSFQAVMKLGNYFMGYRMPEYLSGPGSIQKLPEFMLKKGAKKALVVTDKGLMRLGLPNGLLKALEENNIEYIVFSDVKPNPTSSDVEAGYKLYAENNCQCIVAFGGGSPIDCAKAVAARVACPTKTLAQMKGLLRVNHRLRLLIAIPTTSGSGSETTLSAVITDEKADHKYIINDFDLIPHYTLLDPKLTKDVPPALTATSGMDALCHAVEAYIGKATIIQLRQSMSEQLLPEIYKIRLPKSLKIKSFQTITLIFSCKIP